MTVDTLHFPEFPFLIVFYAIQSIRSSHPEHMKVFELFACGLALFLTILALVVNVVECRMSRLFLQSIGSRAQTCNVDWSGLISNRFQLLEDGRLYDLGMSGTNSMLVLNDIITTMLLTPSY